MVASSRTGLQLLLSVVLVVAFHSGAAAADQGPSRAPVGAPRHSSTTMVPPMGPPPRSSTETPAQLAPSPAPAAASDDCMNTLLDNLSTCLTYVEDGSNLTRPEKGCCQGFSTVVKTNPVCLCSLVTKTDIYGVAINHTKSLMLPTVCRVKTPPVSICATVIAGGPAASSPAGAPSGAAPMGPTLPAEAATPAASPPAGSGADRRFASSSVLVLLAAGLSMATYAMF